MVTMNPKCLIHCDHHLKIIRINKIIYTKNDGVFVGKVVSKIDCRQHSTSAKSYKSFLTESVTATASPGIS